MTSGDEPQLGGQDRDNAPMISGRGTKIIADARGAYQARNFRTFVYALPHEQQYALRIELFRHVFEYVRARLERTYASYTELSGAIEVIERWLQEPTIYNVNALREDDFRTLLMSADPRPRSLLALVVAAWQGGDHYPIHFATAISMIYGEDGMHERVLNIYMREWSLEAGWAWIQGKTIPPLRYDPDSLDLLF